MSSHGNFGGRLRYTFPTDGQRERYAKTACAAYSFLYDVFKEALARNINPDDSEEHLRTAFEIHSFIENKIPDPNINFTTHSLSNRKLFDIKLDRSPVMMKPNKRLDVGGCKLPFHLYGVNYTRFRDIRFRDGS